jgi:hypothetical protein
MNPEKYRKRSKAPQAGDRLRKQIATEAARRLLPRLAEAGEKSLADLGEAELYTAKRKAAAVLGHAVRPGDLPSDSEVREAAVVLLRDRSPSVHQPEPEPDATPMRMGDHLDRFAIYRMRLEPLETVKQNPRSHPEGDALYHSLQVFELAQVEKPYDEEFLLAALLHDVGKAIDPSDHVAASLTALEGAIPERTAWLIKHQHDAIGLRDGSLGPKAKLALGTTDEIEELLLFRALDEAGRVPGAPVRPLEEALEYLRGLENEAYLGEGPGE